MFNEILKPANCLINCNPLDDLYLACGMLTRGNIQMSDITKNIDLMKTKMSMIPWNIDGFKIGLCNTKPIGSSYSILSLSNNCAIKHTLSNIRSKFLTLYRVKAHTHHYTNYMNNEYELFDQSLNYLSDVIMEYAELDTNTAENYHIPQQFTPLL